ncbi:MAG: hypothetical protein GX820_10115 [Bacteroidales bacterium]|nr:hypothetical protein [Bacteroidales bacterium]
MQEVQIHIEKQIIALIPTGYAMTLSRIWGVQIDDLGCIAGLTPPPTT